MNASQRLLVPCATPDCPALVEGLTLYRRRAGCPGCTGRWQPARYAAHQLAFCASVLHAERPIGRSLPPPRDAERTATREVDWINSADTASLVNGAVAAALECVPHEVLRAATTTKESLMLTSPGCACI